MRRVLIASLSAVVDSRRVNPRGGLPAFNMNFRSGALNFQYIQALRTRPRGWSSRAASRLKRDGLAVLTHRVMAERNDSLHDLLERFRVRGSVQRVAAVGGDEGVGARGEGGELQSALSAVERGRGQQLSAFPQSDP